MKNANDFFGSRSGTVDYHKHAPSGYLYTDGVGELADKCDAYWLIDLILAHQLNTGVRRQSFQVWHLNRIKETEFKITCTDGNDEYITHQDISFSDFPYEVAILWFIDGCLLMPIEY